MSNHNRMSSHEHAKAVRLCRGFSLLKNMPLFVNLAWLRLQFHLSIFEGVWQRLNDRKPFRSD